MDIVDSDLSWRDALLDNPAFPCPLAIRLTQAVIAVRYYSFDGRIHRGQLVIRHGLVVTVQVIFAQLLHARFPIGKMRPIVRYGWDDGASMADNNTSGFNYRYIAGTQRLSRHALGFAIDINPMQNPCVAGGNIDPPGAVYNPRAPGALTADSLAVRLFRNRGFDWGGGWESPKDYQHFEWPARL